MLYAVGLIIAFVLAWKWHKEGVTYTDEEIYHCNINNE